MALLAAPLCDWPSLGIFLPDLVGVEGVWPAGVLPAAGEGAILLDVRAV